MLDRFMEVTKTLEKKTKNEWFYKKDGKDVIYKIENFQSFPINKMTRSNR